MKNYIEVTLVPDEMMGASEPVLMGHIMERLHLGLVGVKDDRGLVPIGISFPGYNENYITLGKKLRLHARSDELQNLGVKKLLSKMHDYVHVTSLRQVPMQKMKGFVSFSRVRFQPGRKLLERRRMKRHGIEQSEAEEAYRNYDIYMGFFLL